ncbi:type III-B CRISPR module RAMP protein Cmr1 [Kosmotoga olearia]|uniref:CRISPR-associated RAMP protein, Cmr1 family n=1 Tax=Kosmotoga olearia (strain ATCC BAA-1733 / DSM 21960 / TBF 19.5.1) TaxID=521045 RepID=C5CFA6_KOSOT|nr:type III-B CRISPR module RAMP protein Cmr1 [Kosmotoga olearia]ACR79383.1 CRISPR-associated RAMP protein, Cmr1 family [Kosmotoga olearia TBF 19.5.1]
MRNEPITFKIKTLTPLWTGGADEKMDRIHETGIIGSIRWWYEVVARGLGYHVCDPTSDNRCGLSGKEKNNEERISKLCPACYLFGTTGWKRMFNLQITSEGKQPVEGNKIFCQVTNSKINKNWLRKVFEQNLDDKNFFGSLELKILSRNSEKQVEDQLKAVLSIMSEFGSIGAKPQFGYGLFELIDKKETKESLRKIHKFLEKNNFKKSNSDEGIFSLKNYWKFETDEIEANDIKNTFLKNPKYIGSNHNDLYISMSFDIRYMLRKRYLQKSKSKEATSEIFGGTKGDKWASRVFVSSFYKENQHDDKYKLRIWGFTERYIADIIREIFIENGEYNKIFSNIEIVTLNKTLREVTEIDS